MVFFGVEHEQDPTGCIEMIDGFEVYIKEPEIQIGEKGILL